MRSITIANAFLALFASIVRGSNNTALIVPEPTGPYGVAYQDFELVDTSRIDPFNASHSRRLMISRYTPIPRSECICTTIRYCSPAACDLLWSQYNDTSIERDILLPVCASAPQPLHPINTTTEAFPVALFSPGLGLTRIIYHHAMMQFASQGFIVYSIDHTYDNDPVVFPDGEVIHGGRIIPPSPLNNFSTVSMEFGLQVRAKDASFVLDKLGFKHEEQKAVIFGHSYGGATAAAALLNDKRFRAGVNLDGTMYAPTLSNPLGAHERKQAFMLFGSAYPPHWSAYDPSWQQFWNTTRRDGQFVDYMREFVVNETVHISYGDGTWLFEELGVPESYKPGWPTQQLTRTVRVHEIVAEYLSALFWWALGMKELDSILVDKDSALFPEVLVVSS